MPDLEIHIPGDLGLSEEQTKKLEESFLNQLADLVKGSQANAAVSARPIHKGGYNVVTVKTQEVIDA